jgi:hypothetical protein
MFGRTGRIVQCVFLSTEAVADASNNVGALNVNSFIVLPPKVVSRWSNTGCLAVADSI